MGSVKYFLLFAWLLQNDLAVALAPLLASSNICNFNPTQTTIALEKPYCFFTSPNALNVYLYVVRNDATNTALVPANRFSTTSGGASAPYVAAIFANPNCVNPPITSQIYDLSLVQTTLDKYVVRVGNNVNCFNIDPCNAPLQSSTQYRFLYAFYDSTLTLQFNSTWSAPISTNGGKSFSSIDTWPGRRSGGMIVITSILSVLTFFVLAGLVAAIITNIMSPTTNAEPTQYETSISHSVPQKAEAVEYSEALPSAERYAPHPQA